MTAKIWLTTSEQLRPGAEILRADRRFQVWQYTASHCQALLRSSKGTDRLNRTHDTRVDVLFKATDVMKISTVLDDLVIRVATRQEAGAIRAQSPILHLGTDSHVLLLESSGESGYIIAGAVGWCEDRLDDAAPSEFADHEPGTPAWRRTPLFGVHAWLGGNYASAGQLIDALTAGAIEPGDRTRYRDVFVVQAKFDLGTGATPEVHCVGAFLTRAEAETACDRLTARNDECWIEDIPIGI